MLLHDLWSRGVGTAEAEGAVGILLHAYAERLRQLRRAAR